MNAKIGCEMGRLSVDECMMEKSCFMKESQQL